MDKPFAGKTIAITGAAGGIGLALCRHFGEAGATIAALDRSERVLDLPQQLGADGIAVKAAVAHIDDAAAVAAVRASSQSAQVLMGYSPGSTSAVAGFSARNVPLERAGRQRPAIKTGRDAMMGKVRKTEG